MGMYRVLFFCKYNPNLLRKKCQINEVRWLFFFGRVEMIAVWFLDWS
jgi:hypothetical protein